MGPFSKRNYVYCILDHLNLVFNNKEYYKHYKFTHTHRYIYIYIYIYINDIPHSPQYNNSSLHIFADDTLITAQSYNPANAAEQIKRSMDQIEPWLQKWRIQINPHKCKAIIYSKRYRHLKQVVPPLQVSGQNINWNTEVKYLGLTLDRKLLFNTHIHSPK